jgi:hypothetical protein
VRISTSAFLKEAFDRGAEQFQWKERIARPKRSGTKVRGVGYLSLAAKLSMKHPTEN